MFLDFYVSMLLCCYVSMGLKEKHYTVGVYVLVHDHLYVP